MRAATLRGRASRCYRELFGATGADFVAVGEFDADEVARAGRGAVRRAGRRRARSSACRRATSTARRFENELVTPDKANAVLRGGLNLRMRDDHPDFPAMVLANHLLGGSSTGARAGARAREGRPVLQHLHQLHLERASTSRPSFRVSSIFAPQNRARVESAIREELARAVRDGFSADEVEAGKKVAARGAAPGAHAGPRARRPARLLPVRQAHLRLGHRLRGEDRRAHAGAGQRRAAQAHRPGAAVGRGRRATFKKN